MSNPVLGDDEDPTDTIAITCGPPIMIKFALMSFRRLGFTDEQTYTTLEKRMKCGIGICGRCNVGPKYVCVNLAVAQYVSASTQNQALAALLFLYREVLGREVGDLEVTETSARP